MLLRQLMDAGVITLIATIRTGEHAQRGGGGADFGRIVHHVELNAFDMPQTEALLQRGPRRAGRQGTTVRDMHAVSGGNVLFLRELVRGALDNNTPGERRGGVGGGTRRGVEHDAADRTHPRQGGRRGRLRP